MARSHIKFASIAFGLALAGSACGGANDEALIQAMADEMVSSADGLSSDPSEAECVANTSYESLGADRLAELGITVENPDLTTAEVTKPEAEQLVDGLYDCLDVNAMITSQITATGLPASAAQCMIDGLGDEAIRDLMVEQFEGEEPDLGPEAETQMLACLAGDS